MHPFIKGLGHRQAGSGALTTTPLSLLRQSLATKISMWGNGWYTEPFVMAVSIEVREKLMPEGWGMLWCG